MAVEKKAVKKLLCLTGILLGSCAGRMGFQLPAADEVLIPQIHADGTKFFLFQRDYLRPSGDPSDRFLGREVPGQPDLRSADLDHEIERRLDDVLLQTGYCRQGYFELYRDSTRERFALRGECREVATDADRSRFDGAPLPIPASR